MLRATSLKVISGIALIVLIIKLLTVLFIEPQIRNKAEAVLNEKIKDYSFHIEKVHIKLLLSGIQVNGITFFSKKVHKSSNGLTGKIESIKIIGINIPKALFKKGIKIRKIIISTANVNGEIPFPEKSKLQLILPLNIQIGEILIDKTILSVKNSLNSQAYQVKDGMIKVYNLHLIKQDTLYSNLFKDIDFEAGELTSVAPDSMYTYSVKDISYVSTVNKLSAVNFIIQPNYTDYDFTSRYKYQKDRIEASFININLQNFNAADYLLSGKITSSIIEIGSLEMNVFRDKRKEFRHINRDTFQEMIYSYKGFLRIDTICIPEGNIIYREHAEKANDQGYITFNKINAEIYNISNDSVYITEEGFLELRCKALLMDEGKLEIQLKSRIFDEQNTFSVSGSLSEMEITGMNPYLWKSAFIYAASGKIDKMNFNFTANNSKAAGKMTILYNGLEFTVKNKDTDDKTAFRERVISAIANWKIINSNPVKGEEVRTGTIEYKRDPEKFLFSYSARSILSGIKSTILKSQKK